MKKREDGHLLQRWTRQELRVHEHKHGIRLVQWREQQTGARSWWSAGAWNFDGVLTAHAQRELAAYLNAHSSPEGSARARSICSECDGNGNCCNAEDCTEPCPVCRGTGTASSTTREGT